MTQKRRPLTWRNILTAAGAALLASCAAVEAKVSSVASAETRKVSDERSKAIEKAVAHLISENQIPGAFVMVAEHGQIVHAEAKGYADVENRVPVTEDTIFRFYSMTKPLTCATVMTLYDDGLIGLDDPIKDYLPELAHMRVKTQGGLRPATVDITIRNLMTHTSGFSYAVLPGVSQQDYIDSNVFAIRNRLSESLEDHVKRLAGMPLVADPGTVWNYGESMGVLGRLVEVVSGKPFRTYMKERVLTPLAMDDTDFYVPAEKSDRLAQLYHMSLDGALSNADDDIQYGGSYLEKPLLEYGGAGLVGTPGNYMSFAQMLLNGGRAGDHRILSEESVRLMTSNQLDDSFGDAPLASSGRGPGIGFGFCGLVIRDVPEGAPPAAVGEYGWGGWASTNFWIDPRNQIAGLVFTQVIPDDIGSIQLSNDVRAAIYSADE
tara:strand:+ start:4637 stop:5938 length:1302 start_codon:yes stop_codon:yes gene_type:complete